MAFFKFKNEEGVWETIEPPGAVKYIEQSLSETEKQIARNNIGSYIKRDVIFSGSTSTSFTFPADKAPADYDLIHIQFASNGGSPGGTAIFDPNGSYAVPTTYFVDINGAVNSGIVSGITSTSKGATVTMSATYQNGTVVPKIFKVIGYKFEKEA